VLERHSRLADGLLEGIEIHHDEIDRRDVVGRRLLDVILVVAQEKKAAVDFWMQRLHAAVEHLGKTGDVGNVGDGEPGVAQRLRGAAGGDEFITGGNEGLGEIDEAGFIGNGEEGAFGHGNEW